MCALGILIAMFHKLLPSYSERQTFGEYLRRCLGFLRTPLETCSSVCILTCPPPHCSRGAPSLFVRNLSQTLASQPPGLHAHLIWSPVGILFFWRYFRNWAHVTAIGEGLWRRIYQVQPEPEPEPLSVCRDTFTREAEFCVRDRADDFGHLLEESERKEVINFSFACFLCATRCL